MVFSPYGLVSMALLVYEGATGQAAAEIYNTLHLPWHRDIVRIGFRDLHRYLRSYFSSEGFLKGLVLSKPNVHLRPQYVEVLKFYGFQSDTAITQAVFTTQMFSLGNATTNVPVTSTITVPTTLTTMKEVMTTAPVTTTTFGVQNKTETTTTTTFGVQNKTETTSTTTFGVQNNTETTTTTTFGVQNKTETISATTFGVENKTETVVLDTTTPPITTTLETATEIVTATNKVPTLPEVLAMQGPVTTSVPTTQKPTITTLKPGEATYFYFTTIIGETTKTEAIPTETTKTEVIPTETTITEAIPTETTTTTEALPTETTKTEAIPTETTKTETVLPVTFPTQKTTMRIETTTDQSNMEATTHLKEFITTLPPTKAIVNQEMQTEIVTEMKVTTLPSTKTTLSQETETETATTEMNVVTLTVKQPPQLESMDMVLHKPNKTEKDKPYSTQSNFQNETEEATTEPIRSIFSQLIPVDNKKEKKKETFTKYKEPTPFSTMIVDTTIPFEELVILTTPPDAEVIEDKGSSMLEAIIILEENENEPTSYPDITTDNTIKRATKYEPEVSNRQTATYFQQHPTTFSYIFSSLNGINHTQTTYLPDESLQEQKDNLIVNSYEYSDQSEESTSSVESTSETLYTGHTQLMENGVSVDDISSGTSIEEEEKVSGFPTLEPDTIIFPTISDPRLPRSIKSDERPQAQLGNWVGVAATWRSNPTDHWFWTYSGDKLVPVLTYTAFLPYSEVPALQARVLQLPLDDARYSLLVLLPNSSHGLKQMLHSLQWNPLRTILKSLKPTPVYAVIPAFTIVKHINLTPALHKLGIRNVFDAYVANLAEMSDEPHLYVRSVEQTITISVRKYFAYHKWFEASPSQVERNFLATHPFAYFVMDEETKVALIAGTIVDPLQHTT